MKFAGVRFYDPMRAFSIVLSETPTTSPKGPEGAAASAPQWSSSLFSKHFELELDPCPEAVAELYGTPQGGIVTLDQMLSENCDDWLEFEGSCYFKSSYLESSISWKDADSR